MSINPDSLVRKSAPALPPTLAVPLSIACKTAAYAANERESSSPRNFVRCSGRSIAPPSGAIGQIKSLCEQAFLSDTTFDNHFAITGHVIITLGARG